MEGKRECMKKEVLPQLCQVPGGQSELIWAGKECDKVYLQWLMAMVPFPSRNIFRGYWIQRASMRMSTAAQDHQG